MATPGDDARGELLAAYYADAMGMLPERAASYDALVVCILDPADGLAMGLIEALGKKREAKKAVKRARATKRPPAMVIVLPLQAILPGIERLWPDIAARLAGSPESFLENLPEGSAGVRVICLAAGGVTCTAYPLDRKASDALEPGASAFADPFETVLHKYGEKIRTALNAAKPDGGRQIAVVAQQATGGGTAFELSFKDKAWVVASFQARDEPEIAETLGQPIDAGSIMVLFILLDGTSHALPMQLDSILS
jgi:hypothetical protein